MLIFFGPYGVQAARQRSRLSVAEVLHRISLPVLVRPRAPAGLQKAPACTPVRIESVVGLVVRGALVVRFGAGLGLVRVGLGLVRVGLGVGFDVGLGALVVGTRLGDAETAGSARACTAVGDALAAGLSEPESVKAAMPLPQQHSSAIPKKPAATFCPRVTGRFGPFAPAAFIPTVGGRVCPGGPYLWFPPAGGNCAVGYGGTLAPWVAAGR
ncbi:hypothetical protein LQ51_02275 [Micromonospora sp. HK10]|nr:hypothetical protein LQ51_02275 [Micromonospora sp. HK10]